MILAQLMEFLPSYEFRKYVERYQEQYKAKRFSCREQSLCVAFAELIYHESLRDIEVCLRARQSKLYGMGFRGKVARNRLANANTVGYWRIFADFDVRVGGRHAFKYLLVAHVGHDDIRQEQVSCFELGGDSQGIACVLGSVSRNRHGAGESVPDFSGGIRSMRMASTAAK